MWKAPLTVGLTWKHAEIEREVLQSEVTTDKEYLCINIGLYLHRNPLKEKRNTASQYLQPWDFNASFYLFK